MNAVALVESEVRELVRRRGLDPSGEPAAVRRLVEEVLVDYDERSLSGNLPQLVDKGDTARAVFDAVAGFGPLQRWLDDPTVEEIWINEPGRVFVAVHGRSQLTTTILTALQVRDLLEPAPEPWVDDDEQTSLLDQTRDLIDSVLAATDLTTKGKQQIVKALRQVEDTLIRSHIVGGAEVERAVDGMAADGVRPHLWRGLVFGTHRR